MRGWLTSIPVAALVIVLSMMLAGCDRDRVYSGNHRFPDQGWCHGDTVSFGFSIADTSARYNMYLDLDHTTAYPFQNLYVRIHSAFPDGKVLTEQHSLELQEKTGEWLGGCNGTACAARIVLRERMYFDKPGEYRLSFEQYTRTDCLAGIEKLSLVLDRAVDKQ